MRCCRDWRVFRCSRGGRCRGAFRAGIRARIAGRASSLPSIANMCPATTCGGWTGGLTAGRIGSSSRNSRPIRTSAAAWCWTPAGRWVSARSGSRSSNTPAASPGRSGHLALQQGDAVGLSCVAGGIVRNIPPKRNPSHLMSVFDVLEQTEPQGQTQLVPVLHELAETISQRALVVIISDLFVEPEALAVVLSALAVPRHDAAIFHLLDPRELGLIFAGRCGFSTWRGGRRFSPSPTRSPIVITRPCRAISTDFQQVVLESAVDYHRVTIDENFEQVLVRFLVGRTRSKGVR